MNISFDSIATNVIYKSKTTIDALKYFKKPPI